MRIIGHRGARHEAPENTVAGFIHAQRNGCSAFELDVQQSLDRELVVFHDTTLLRTTGISGALGQFNQRQLSGINANYGFIRRVGICPIPTLEEVIDSSPSCMDWQFEVKPESWFKSRQIARALSRLILQKNVLSHCRCTVTSSSKRFLRLVKELAPEIRTGLVVESDGQRAVQNCEAIGAELLVINRKLLEKSHIRDANRKEIEVSVWTVNDINEMHAFQKMGVDSIITDIPSTAIRLFSI